MSDEKPIDAYKLVVDALADAYKRITIEAHDHVINTIEIVLHPRMFHAFMGAMPQHDHQVGRWDVGRQAFELWNLPFVIRKGEPR